VIGFAVGRRSAEIGLVTVAAGWGLTFTLIQDAVDSLPPTAFIAFRFLLAALILGVPYARGLGTLSGSGWLAGGLLGLLLLGGYLFQTFGLVHTTASNAGFITGLYVIFTPLLGWVALRQRLSGWAWSCVGVCAAGLFLLSGPGGGWHPFGDTLMLGCSVALAAHILVTDWAVAHFPIGPLVTVQLTVCGVVALVVAIVSGDLMVPRGQQVWTALLFTAVVASAIAYFIQSHVQVRTSPTRTSLILATEPAFAGVFGYLLAGDRLAPLAWLGAAVMILGILMMEAKPVAPVRQRPCPSARVDPSEGLD